MTIFKFNNNNNNKVPCRILEDGTVITEPFPESAIIGDILKKE